MDDSLNIVTFSFKNRAMGPSNALPPNIRTLPPQRELDENGYEFVYPQAHREQARRDLMEPLPRARGPRATEGGTHIRNGVIRRRRGRLSQAFDSVNLGPPWWRYIIHGAVGVGTCLAVIRNRKAITSWIKEWIFGTTGQDAYRWAAPANEYAAQRFHYNDPNSRWKQVAIR